ncbi:phosphoribosylanthranilate isomerase [Marivirga arenosa]|uniref:N-(5'-phosphoribosyl)anthranilate isomerase n=1 Tax=Marivirga arenosa TaxID=3059076 RepID=A0AA49JHP6_9BACT|nr:phosphoribosylanthranilate isomerase [Marivirga sp. BKB1-2]WKK81871.2 phosphoribosylanthranilate isomerase [Marivirga sp. BKB1-2]
MKKKICGMREVQNVKDVLEYNPDYMGFIFYEKSSRFVGKDQMQELIKLNFGETERVGVFVNESFDKILEYADLGFFDIVQLHGKESPEQVEKLKAEGLEVIKVFSVGDDFDGAQLKAYKKADYYLFDTKGKLPGGNGEKFDWSVLNSAAINKPFFLSGGLDENDTNIDKSQFKNLYGLDFNSKLELEPGFKDVIKVQEVLGT